MAKTSRIQLVAGEPSNSAMDVVFVHGLGGNDRDYWMSDKSDYSTYWPAWIVDSLRKSGLRACVYSIDYEAARFKWSGNPMAIQDRAINLLQWLSAESIGTRPLVFISHSFGGLLVKAMLRSAELYEPYRSISKSCTGVVFLATPHQGSDIADIARLLGGPFATVALEDCRALNPYILELGDWFRTRALQQRMRVLVFRETQPTRPLNRVIVDAGSSNPNIPGIPTVPVDADHISICKQVSRSEPLYKGIVRFLQDCSVAQSTPGVRVELDLTSEAQIRVYFSAALTDLRFSPAQTPLQMFAEFDEVLTCFGPTPSTPRDQCLEMLESADLALFGAGLSHRHLSARRKSIPEYELEHATSLGLAHVCYVQECEAGYESNNLRLNRFRELLLRSETCRRFNDPGELHSLIAEDLRRCLLQAKKSVDQERNPKLQRLHRRILNLMDEGDLRTAVAELQRLCGEHPFSPRGHYNQACVYCRMAAGLPAETNERQRLLRFARRRLASAMKYGISGLILLSSSPDEERSAAERITSDPDLQILFRNYPSLIQAVHEDDYQSVELHYSGCVCGCM